MPIYEASERVLRAFQDELMPAESLSEIFDVVGQYPSAACSFPPRLRHPGQPLTLSTLSSRSPLRDPRPRPLPAGLVELFALTDLETHTS